MISENETLKTIFHRKSIRHFNKKTVSRDLLETIILAGQRAPTSDNLQMYSFILISNNKLRSELIEICEKQKSVKEAPILIVFCADIHRLTQQANQLEINHCFKRNYGLSPKFFSIFDACLAAQNMVIAAESLGLGSVFIASPFENITKIVKLLNLPQGVLPISLLCIGYPSEEPKKRPRWPTKCVFFENSYRELSEDEIRNYLMTNKKTIAEEITKGYLESLDEFLDLERNKKTELVLKENLRRTGFFNFTQ